MTVSDVLFAMIQTGLILFKLGGIGTIKAWGWTMVLAPTWICFVISLVIYVIGAYSKWISKGYR